MMRRRAFLAIATPLISWPFQAAAQSDVPMVGILALGNPSPAPFIQAIKSGLADLGYEEGKNIRFEVRSAEGVASKLGSLAHDLVALKVGVLVAYQTPAATAAKAATNDMPIVMAAVADPVGGGFVKSLSHPGGNITGVSGVTSEIGAKNLELIKEAVPAAKRVVVLANEPDPFHKRFIENIQSAGAKSNSEIKAILAKASDDFDRHFEDIKSWGADAVIAQPSLPLGRVVESAARSKIPTACPNSAYTDAGGLMSYSADFRIVHKQVAAVVDKILKGRKPADLPVEFTTSFRLIINAKAASAMGLALPPLLLARADEVIE
jgi:putative tryptophan/tyrosine transport system substrate-binding protein